MLKKTLWVVGISLMVPAAAQAWTPAKDKAATIVRDGVTHYGDPAFKNKKSTVTVTNGAKITNMTLVRGARYNLTLKQATVGSGEQGTRTRRQSTKPELVIVDGGFLSHRGIDKTRTPNSMTHLANGFKAFTPNIGDAVRYDKAGNAITTHGKTGLGNVRPEGFSAQGGKAKKDSTKPAAQLASVVSDQTTAMGINGVNSYRAASMKSKSGKVTKIDKTRVASVTIPAQFNEAGKMVKPAGTLNLSELGGQVLKGGNGLQYK